MLAIMMVFLKFFLKTTAAGVISTAGSSLYKEQIVATGYQRAAIQTVSKTIKKLAPYLHAVKEKNIEASIHYIEQLHDNY